MAKEKIKENPKTIYFIIKINQTGKNNKDDTVAACTSWTDSNDRRHNLIYYMQSEPKL